MNQPLGRNEERSLFNKALDAVFLMERFYIVIKPPPQLLCERVAETRDGYLLYEHDQGSGIFVDSGYVESIEALKFAIRARYGFSKSVYLTTSFEEAVKHFDVSPPRIINIVRYDVFCVRKGDILFYAKWDHDAKGNAFLKRFEWRLDGEEPKSIDEAIERLSEYAIRHDRWVVSRHLLKQIVAHEVHPDN
jgi:hypothetical protein